MFDAGKPRMIGLPLGLWWKKYCRKV